MKRVNSTVGMSGEIEAVVTKLLRTTKALLEALTQWSHMRASNSDIFEIHDTLERQFFLVSQAFEEFNVSMGDLQWIPRQLRDSVSVCMLETPSPAVLDQYLPRIREVIVSLLQGLKGKQALLRDRERERESRGSVRSSTNTESWNREVPLAALNRGSGTQRSMMMYPPPSSPPLPPMSSPRMNNQNTSEYDPWSGGMPRPSMPTNDLSSRIMPPRNNSVSSRSYSPPQHHSPNIQHQQIPLPSRSTSSGRNNISMPNATSNIPPPPPPPPRPDPPVIQKPVAKPPVQQEFDESDPNTASALAALKRQENLARRSSVRRASMFRGNNTDYQGGSISSRSGGSKNQPYFPHQQIEVAPPVPSLPAHALQNYDQSPNNTGLGSSRLNTVSEDVKEVPQEQEEKKDKSLTLFLQIGKDVQKVNYQGEISIPALNMLFLEKFSYSVGQNDFPKIYIRDPSIGVSYELVDLDEIKNKSVLSFNINEKEDQKELLQEVANTFNKELEETRRIFVEQMDELKKQITESSNKSEENIKQVLLTQPKAPVAAPPAPADAIVEEGKDTEETKEVTNENVMPTPSISTAAMIPKEQYDKQLIEIETLRRDMAVLRQLEREMREGTAAVIQEMKEKAEAVKEEAKKHKSAELSKTSVARSNLEEGKKDLLEKSDKVTNRLEELQDTIDQLKLDVTQRKCRPSETMMTHCANERKALSQEIEDFGKFITDVKPRWKKTWEQELQTIVKEQQTLKDQEYLLSDMKDDLDALLEVFEQLEKIYAYQANARPQPRQFIVAPAEEGFEGMSSVFKQVATIDVDHDRRLRALEQADKMRQRELANRIDDFEKELVGFVGEKKLKKTGGALEIDRLRKEKEEAMLKEMYAANKKATATPTASTSTTTTPAAAAAAEPAEAEQQEQQQEETLE